MRVVAAFLIIIALAACASQRIEYQPIPAWLIPERPALPTINAAELACLSDPTYAALAQRERLRAQETAELRALLEVGRAP